VIPVVGGGERISAGGKLVALRRLGDDGVLGYLLVFWRGLERQAGSNLLAGDLWCSRCSLPRDVDC
jgi:hypothetical protein